MENCKEKVYIDDMAYRLSFLVVPRSVNSRTSLLPQHHEAVELQQAVPYNLVKKHRYTCFIDQASRQLTPSRSINTQKKEERAQYQAILTKQLGQ